MQTIGQIFIEAMTNYLWARDILLAERLDFDGEIYARPGQIRQMRYRLEKSPQPVVAIGDEKTGEASE